MLSVAFHVGLKIGGQCAVPGLGLAHDPLTDVYADSPFRCGGKLDNCVRCCDALWNTAVCLLELAQLRQSGRILWLSGHRSLKGRGSIEDSLRYGGKLGLVLGCEF